ncbi:MAG: type II toxin-antitoxin system VapC family toxin [Deltaproteobacteria bacterium]|nr:type II toxin-antitoxin system VapC family toxin [Deltaproteobacteria bacterium]
MIIPDINLLVFAHNTAAPLHEPARRWWEDLLSREQPVALPWAVTFGFVRLVTHPAVLTSPLEPLAALDRVESWFNQPSVQPLDLGPRHLSIVRSLFATTNLGGRLTTDTHLAALAMEHQCELHSNDNDFDRFPGLRWHNPLRQKRRV